MPGKPHRPPNSILTTVRDKHTQGNRRAKDDWSLYAHHRAHLTAAIASLAPPAPFDAPLVLLGAGNCNDVDLVALAPHFRAIHLVDIDASALDRARARLSPELRARVHAHGGDDLTGLLTTLGHAASSPAPLNESTIAAGVAAITAAVPVRDAAVVVSCCLLSQLGWSLEEASHGDESRGMELRMAALAIHLRTMVALARPGAAVLIAADITSSELYPLEDLDAVDASDSAASSPLATLATQLIAAQTQIFAAANPVLLNRVLRRDPLCQAALVEPRTLPPWLWTGPFDRIYLVYPQVWRISTKP